MLCLEPACPVGWVDAAVNLDPGKVPGLGIAGDQNKWPTRCVKRKHLFDERNRVLANDCRGVKLARIHFIHLQGLFRKNRLVPTNTQDC